MQTQYYTAASLDGFIATEDHSLDWLMQLDDIEVTSFPQFIQDVGALAMGAATYRWLLEHHLKPGTPDAQPWPYTQPAWVFTHRELPIIPGADIRFVRGDVRPVHQDMVAAAGGKNVWLVGGGELVGQFHDAGLLDELIIQLAAVTLGRGFPLLPRRIAFPPLKLLSVTRCGEAFVELRYAVPKTAGECL
jgi:dihydrofolate reductase